MTYFAYTLNLVSSKNNVLAAFKRLQLLITCIWIPIYLSRLYSNQSNNWLNRFRFSGFCMMTAAKKTLVLMSFLSLSDIYFTNSWRCASNHTENKATGHWFYTFVRHYSRRVFIPIPTSFLWFFSNHYMCVSITMIFESLQAFL